MRIEAKLMGKGDQRLTIVVVSPCLWAIEYEQYKKAREQGFTSLINTTVEPPEDAEHLIEKGVFIIDGDISAVRYCEERIPYRFERAMPKAFNEGLPGWWGNWISVVDPNSGE
jgi:hypothetical protein